MVRERSLFWATHMTPPPSIRDYGDDGGDINATDEHGDGNDDNDDDTDMHVDNGSSGGDCGDDDDVWNMVVSSDALTTSVPADVGDAAVAGVLSDFAGEFAAVRAYQGCDA